MAKKFYYMNGNGLLLCRMDIIGHSRNDINKITIDVKRLFEVTDEELMSYRNVPCQNQRDTGGVEEIFI